MDSIVRRSIPAGLGLLFNTGLTVSGYANLTIAYILWALMVPLAGFAVWPWVKPLVKKLRSVRLRSPFTTTSVQTGGSQVFIPTVTQENPSDAIQRRNAEIERLKTELADARQEVHDLRERFGNEVQRLEAELEEAQPTDEELKQRCRELANELYEFLKERGHGEGVDYDDPNDPKMVQRSNETIGLYRSRFEGEVLARYEVLKQRGWWEDELLDQLGRNMLTEPRHYLDIRSIAQRLNSIGHRL